MPAIDGILLCVLQNITERQKSQILWSLETAKIVGKLKSKMAWIAFLTGMLNQEMHPWILLCPCKLRKEAPNYWKKQVGSFHHFCQYVLRLTILSSLAKMQFAFFKNRLTGTVIFIPTPAYHLHMHIKECCVSRNSSVNYSQIQLFGIRILFPPIF